ncbi:unnamed protein product [Gongylonema pulchrum]|uniref:Succinate dehydrogenase assembly factor 3, mitochondrial n=1 Tax=Gongylonema pulchrum TaxID=637853 RepID=A0A183CWA6_9BILA|nr:unnamed protein product [Gongylonema pulchrum]
MCNDLTPLLIYNRFPSNDISACLVLCEKTLFSLNCSSFIKIYDFFIFIILDKIDFLLKKFLILRIFFPRFILTRHFWTIDQKRRFWSTSIKRSTQMHYHLSRLHRVSLFTGIRGLHSHAETLRCLDRSLKAKSTAIDAMSEQELWQQFYLRRLQYDGLSEEDMKHFLKVWSLT